MLLLVRIDLSEADIALFDAYEARVLPLLATYGATLEARVRNVDQRWETHLLRFPDRTALDRYRQDPERVAAQPMWAQCGAQTESTEVVAIDGAQIA